MEFLLDKIRATQNIQRVLRLDAPRWV